LRLPIRIVFSVVVAAAALGVSSAFGVSGGDTITTIAGTGTAGFAGDGGQATSAQLNYPWGLAADAQGAVGGTASLPPIGRFGRLADSGGSEAAWLDAELRIDRADHSGRLGADPRREA
jgi:hypothetical protein